MFPARNPQLSGNRMLLDGHCRRAIGRHCGTKSYEKSADVSGAVVSKGSDTLNNLMGMWSDAFKKLYPNVTFEIESKGRTPRRRR